MDAQLVKIPVYLLNQDQLMRINEQRTDDGAEEVAMMIRIAKVHADGNNLYPQKV